MIREKSKRLARKHRTYLRHASTYNQDQDPTSKIPEPTLAIILGLDLSDAFWPRGELGEANEDWASDPSTQEGIEAFRAQRSASEELRRTGREARQLLAWAVDHQKRLSVLQGRAFEGELVRMLLRCFQSFML